MKTKEDAKALGEEIKKALLQIVDVHERAIKRLDGSELAESYRRIIDNVTHQVRDELLPGYEGTKIILYEDGRSVRDFEFELRRHWNRAIGAYVRHYKHATPSSIKKLLDLPGNESVAEEYERFLIEQVQEVIAPMLKELITPGDDFYLFCRELMARADQKIAVENIAQSGMTPPQLDFAFFGMFGLLVQAERYADDGRTVQAYSALIDASHLLGMHEGASYAMTLFDDIAAKRRAKQNSSKSRDEKDKIKKRAAELFYELAPKDEQGRRRRWGSANDALEEIWSALEKEAHANGVKLKISDRTILSLCQRLQRRDKDGTGLEIRVEVMKIMPDGTKYIVPVL